LQNRLSAQLTPSGWSKQQAAQMRHFGRKHWRYLAAMQYKIWEDYLV